MLRSLRLRLTLMSAVLAGLALSGFAAMAWWSIRDALLDRLDSDMRTHIIEGGIALRPGEAFEAFQEGLARNLAAGDRNKVLILVQDEAGNRLYASAPVAVQLDKATLSWPIWQEPEPHPPPDGQPITHEPPPPPDGHNSPPNRHRPPPDGHIPPPSPPAITLADIGLQGDHWHVALAAFPHFRLAVGVDLSVIEDGMQPVRRAFMVFIPLTLAFIACCAWLFAGGALQRVSRLTTLIGNVTARGLDQRLSPREVDREFAQLVVVFNAMLERLERSFTQASRFSAEAAHELKTPLAILQGQIERAISEADDGSPVQRLLTHILDEVRRLSTISSKLLLLSQADAGRLRLQVAPLDFSSLLEELVDDARMLAPQLKITAQVSAGIVVNVDRDLIIQVLHNLLSNAIKYNKPQGWLRIEATATPQQVEVVVANASNGIHVDDRERIFERFYRADAAHNRTVDGVGLGLSVSREIVRAHGGDLVLQQPRLANEVRFLMTLPRMAAQEK